MFLIEIMFLRRPLVSIFINEIDNLTNTNLLILKEEDTLFQESAKVREHIIEKYEQIGEIGRYKIYKIN